ncbi:flavin reductase family protein [Catenulispora rubra]|uniref:flavin reductase family protein n=1 Tax=Catenulispora rubra TaxID=280293 RepID=UPI0018921147|nr:flavin reductase family protein [Catenulispora rubra]
MPDFEQAVDIRRLMAGFPTGVSIVTATDADGVQRGMTCTSLCSVTLRPPTLLVCLRRDSPTRQAVCAVRGLTVNLLHDRARSVAEMFGAAVPDRFERVPWTQSERGGGAHLIDAAHTIADCAVAQAQDVGDHTVVMAEVVALHHMREPVPLLYGMRRYGAWEDTAEDSLLRYDFIS